MYENGVRLAYDDAGAGHPVLLLVHGWGGDSRTWAAHLPLLRPHHRVVTVDVRGHGHSSTPPTGYDPRTIVGDLAAVLDHLDIDIVVAVGHSWGGQLVTALAVEHPRRVAALVVIDPAYGASDEAALREQSRQWHATDPTPALLRFAEGAFCAQTPEQVRTLVRDGFRNTSAHVLAEAFDAMYLHDDAFGLGQSTVRYLERVTQPVLSLFSNEAAAAIMRSTRPVPGSRIVAWPGTGHYLHLERPLDVVRLMEEWPPAQAHGRG